MDCTATHPERGTQCVYDANYHPRNVHRGRHNGRTVSWPTKDAALRARLDKACGDLETIAHELLRDGLGDKVVGLSWTAGSYGGPTVHLADADATARAAMTLWGTDVPMPEAHTEALTYRAEHPELGKLTVFGGDRREYAYQRRVAGRG